MHGRSLPFLAPPTCYTDINSRYNFFGTLLGSGACQDDGEREAGDMTQQQALYPIRVLSSLTGVNSVTLRAWERRYGLLRPQRTEKGHRLYSSKDVDRVQHILQLLDRGISVSQVGRVLDRPNARSGAVEASAKNPWKKYISAMLAAVHEFDEGNLETAYNEALALYPVDLVTRHLILPMLAELGKDWQGRRGAIAEQHFFEVFIRNKIGARIHHQARNAAGPHIVAACMPGERHDLGLLLFCLYAMERDYRVIMLGADMPLMDVPTVVQRSRSRAVVLVANYAIDDSEFSRDLPKLVKAARVPVFVGGHLAVDRRSQVERTGARALGDDITEGFERIHATLQGAGGRARSKT